MPRAGETVRSYSDLRSDTARKGRRVRVSVDGKNPGMGTGEAERIRSWLGGNIVSGTEPGDGTGMEFTGGGYFSVWVTGPLRASWDSMMELREAARVGIASEFPGIQSLGIGFQDREESDLITFNPTIKDPEVNPDGTVNWNAVARSGTREGLHNFGSTVGSIGREVGSAVGEAAQGIGSGLASGLGWGGTIVVIGILLLVLGIFLFPFLAPALAAL